MWAEIAYVAYHIHWPFDTIVDLEHPTRIRLIEEIVRLDAHRSTPEAAAVARRDTT